MKRFHIHVHVDNLSANIAFYSRLFGAEPTRIETDYAKWMLDDPRVNFAISTRGNKPGLDHLGFQTDTAEELAALRQRAEQADMATLDEGETTCCYARSEKHWIVDPQGIAWEHFHTLDNIPVFKEGAVASSAPCCAPPAAASSTAAAASCCAPAKTENAPGTATAGCCGLTSSKSTCC